MRRADDRQVFRAPVLGGDMREILGLDAGNELNAPRAQFAGQKTVNIERIAGVFPIDHAQGSKRHAMLLQQTCRRHDFVMCRRAALGIAIKIMQAFGAVAAQADNKVMLL